MADRDPLLIYNVFPLLAGSVDEWVQWARHARSMGFNWIYLNPFTEAGLSGSLYAVKHFDRVDPRFLPQDHSPTGFTELQWALHEMKSMGLKVMFDLVVNHTSVDSPLVKEHPEWYEKDENGRPRHPFAIDPADARKKTVWGDLYELDHSNPELLEYFTQVVRFYVRMGADGFRCDAAYKVPAGFWRTLKDAAEQEAGGPVLFLAESLGCTEEELKALQGAGFDYLYDSSKWWNFDAPWLIEQQDILLPIAPTVGFPENHDTERLAHYTGGLEQVQKQRYAFGLAFSQGFQITMGYEWGWRKKPDVVKTTPEDQEPHHMDLTRIIARLNGIRSSMNEFWSPGRWEPVSGYDLPYITLAKRDSGATFYIMVNKDWHQGHDIPLPEPMEVLYVLRDGEPAWIPAEGSISLDRAEVVYGRKVS